MTWTASERDAGAVGAHDELPQPHEPGRRALRFAAEVRVGSGARRSTAARASRRGSWTKHTSPGRVAERVSPCGRLGGARAPTCFGACAVSGDPAVVVHLVEDDPARQHAVLVNVTNLRRALGDGARVKLVRTVRASAC